MFNIFKSKRKLDEEPVANRKVYLNVLPTTQLYDTTNQPLPSSTLPLPVYPTNKIRTTKYTIYNFVPKNLFEQFKRVANIYFLFLIILQLIPFIGDGLRAAFMGSLAFASILVMTMLKDGYEDFNRHKSDNELNNKKCFVLKDTKNFNYFDLKDNSDKRSGDSGEKEHAYLLDDMDSTTTTELKDESNEFKQVLWKEVKVGDIIKLRNNEAIPADLVILSTSEEDNSCYIETKNLDGETNLKARSSLTQTSQLDTKDLRKFQFFVESEPPNVNLYSFTATLNVVEQDRVVAQEPISTNNLLLRGCIVRNVEYVYCLVLCTGTDTKIILNSGITPSKRSYIEVMMNKQVVMNFVILFLMALSVSILSGVWFDQSSTSSSIFVLPYLKENRGGSFVAFLGFFTCLILFQNIVPISLYLTVEVVKSVQAYFIHSDIHMYYKELDTPCVPKAWNLSDDLGQIEYIFSDKTGTLTQNVMEFKQCSIAGVMYGHLPTIISGPSTIPNNHDHNGEVDDQSPMLVSEELDSPFDDRSSTNSDAAATANDRLRVMGEERDRITNNKYRSGPITFIDSQLYMDLRNHEIRQHNIKLFFTILATCHTVLAEVDQISTGPYRQIEYKAQSPDEAALVAAATNVGFTFLTRVQDKIEIDVCGEIQAFKLLNVLEFNSTRKRMSVVIKKLDSEEIILYCKGADSIIMERLAPDNDNTLIQDTLAHLQAFAKTGLRTLCIAYRAIPLSEYEQWELQYREATNSLDDRDAKVMQVSELIETNLMLVGGSAIEDKLQDGVADSISLLRQAGIKIWVLTGDKTETAINIGFSCNLLSDEMTLIVVDGDSQFEVEKQIDFAISQYLGPSNTAPLALVIDGTALKFALLPPLNQKLLEVGKTCKVVVCCRVSPLQKAQVVTLVKDNLDAMTLAIGDGANDVSMIQAAHIGIGIAGLEGYQAVMASDYAIAQFRYLTRLLLVHGRWSYTRISRMILCFFYKNLVMTLTNFWFQWFNGPSQTFLFDYALVLCYNLVFTAFPIMVLGAFDQDVKADVALVTPQLYQRGIKHQEYSHKRFWLVVLDATYQSLICFFLPYLMFAPSTFAMSGNSTNSLDGFGTAVTACVVVTTNLYVGLWTFNWTGLMFFVIGFSIVVFFLALLVFSHIVKSIKAVDSLLFAALDFWLVLLITVIACLLPRFVARYMRSLLKPTDIDIIREQVLLFYNFIKRESKRIKKSKRLLDELRRADTETAAAGHKNWSPFNKVISMRTGKPQEYSGFAFSMDDINPLSEKLKKAVIQSHIHNTRDQQNLHELMSSYKSGINTRSNDDPLGINPPIEDTRTAESDGNDSSPQLMVHDIPTLQLTTPSLNELDINNESSSSSHETTLTSTNP